MKTCELQVRLPGNPTTIDWLYGEEGIAWMRKLREFLTIKTDELQLINTLELLKYHRAHLLI